MLILESIKMAWNSLIKNKLRSGLTLLGIAIGLFSIIVVMTAIGAIQTTVADAFNQLGSNNFVIQKFPAFMGPAQWRLYRNRPDLTMEQGQRLINLTKLPAAIGISFDKNGRIVKYKGEATNPDVQINGVNLDEQKVENLSIDQGRGFSQQDMDYARNICVIGYDVAQKLFKHVYPIGQTIRVDNMNLTVIGVYSKRGSILGQGQDEFISIPLTVYKKYYGDKQSGGFTVMSRSKALINATMDEVIGALRKIRKIPPGTDNDFAIITNDQLVSQFNDITKYFRLGAAVVAFIALAAAGVGIMNIMLVSVSERTREIGIRKAIGARKVTIRTQFLVEAIILCQIGGLIGIFLGIVGGNIIAAELSVSGIIPVEWIVIGILVTTFVGVVFGVYPAIKASNLDPIEALRYE